MPSFIKTDRDEHLWSKAKTATHKNYPELSEDDDKFWAITNKVYHNMRQGINKVAAAPQWLIKLLKKTAKPFYASPRELAEASREAKKPLIEIADAAKMDYLRNLSTVRREVSGAVRAAAPKGFVLSPGDADAFTDLAIKYINLRNAAKTPAELQAAEKIINMSSGPVGAQLRGAKFRDTAIKLLDQKLPTKPVDMSAEIKAAGDAAADQLKSTVNRNRKRAIGGILATGGVLYGGKQAYDKINESEESSSDPSAPKEPKEQSGDLLTDLAWYGGGGALGAGAGAFIDKKNRLRGAGIGAVGGLVAAALGKYLLDK